MRKLRNIVLLLLCPGAVVVAAVLSQFSFRQGDFRSVGTSGVGQRTAASPPCSLPKVLPVPASMVPETHVLLGPYSLAGAKLTVFGGITAGLDDTVAGSAPRSLKITLPRNTNSSLFVGNIGRVSVLSGINVVVRCSDWTNVQGLGVSLYEDAAPTPSSPRHAAYPIYYASGAVQDRYGASYAPWAANTWRVMRIPATYFQPTNNPTEWGDTDAHASKSIAKSAWTGVNRRNMSGSGSRTWLVLTW